MESITDKVCESKYKKEAIHQGAVLLAAKETADRNFLESLANKGFKIVLYSMAKGQSQSMISEMDKVLTKLEFEGSQGIFALATNCSVGKHVISNFRSSKADLVFIYNDFALDNSIPQSHFAATYSWNDILVNVVDSKFSFLNPSPVADPISLSLGPGKSSIGGPPPGLSFQASGSSFLDAKPTHSWKKDFDMFSEQPALQNNNSSSNWDNVSAITTASSIRTSPTVATVPMNSAFEGGSVASFVSNSTAEIDSLYEQNSSQQLGGALTSAFENEVKIDLIQSSTATFVEKLMFWGREMTDSQSIGRNYLFGEDTSDYDSRVEGICRLSIEKVPSSNKFFLSIRGKSSTMIELRSNRIRTMVEEANSSRQVHILQGWTINHKAALTGSDILEQQEESTHGSVSFYQNGGSIYAEVLALNVPSQFRLVSFLSKLQPVETLWRLPKQAMVILDPAELETFHMKYALKLELVHQDANRIDFMSVYAWGFGELLEQAYSVINSVVNEAPSISYSDLRGPSVWNPDIGGHVPSVDNRMYNREVIKKLHRGTYSFADREAGIFYFAFEQQFRDYLEGSFSVLVEDSDNPAEYRPKPSKDNRWMMNDSNMDSMNNKNVVLKISFYGNTAKNVSAARAYLEQLNTSNLARVQIFYPQVSAKKYKEIYNRKSTQLTMLNNLRLRGYASSGTGDYSQKILDPLHYGGFVNIRMKPPMHCHGIRRMALPADVTVTICGSILAEGNQDLLKEVESMFNSVPSDYLYVSVNIPYTHPLKKQLTIKAMREEIIQKYGLVALKWEEGCRATGSVGTARVWALTQESLDALLDEIRSAELETEKFGSMAGLGFNYNPQSQSMFDSAFANAAMPPHAVNSLASSLSALGISQPDGLTGAADSSQAPEARAVIYLPDLTLRYVLLGPPLNLQLSELLQKFNNSGIRTKYPYRDRTDPHAAVLLEGESSGVAAAAKEANALIGNATKELNSVQLLVTEDQYRTILSNDLSCVKYVQGQAGVHLKLDPTQYEIESSRAIFDMRSAKSMDSSRNHSLGFMSMLETSQDHVMESAAISVLITNPGSVKPVEVAVMAKNSEISKWMGKVDGILLVTVDNTASADNQQSFEPQIMTELVPGKFVAKITLRKKSGVEKEDIMNQLTQGLLFVADRGISSIAVVLHVEADEGDNFFCAPDTVRKLFVDNTVDFAKKYRSRSIQMLTRLVCLESTQLLKSSDFETEQITTAFTIDFNDNDVLALALVPYLEKQEVEGARMFDKYRNFAAPPLDMNQSKITLGICNIPLAPNYFGIVFKPQQYGQSNNRGVKTFLMKGLLPGIKTGLETLKNLISTSNPK